MLRTNRRYKVLNIGDENKINYLNDRIKQLENKLIETAQELGCMIDMENARLEQNINSTDLDDPDYFDHQTVHEAMMLAKAT